MNIDTIQKLLDERAAVKLRKYIDTLIDYKNINVRCFNDMNLIAPSDCSLNHLRSQGFLNGYGMLNYLRDKIYESEIERYKQNETMEFINDIQSFKEKLQQLES